MKKATIFWVVVSAIVLFFALRFLWEMIPRELTVEEAATIPPLTTPTINVLLTTEINKSANGLGVTLAPIEVIEDSRCPVDENIRCIQAGTVRVRTKVTSTDGERILIFAIGTPVSSRAETIELTEVLPSPHAGISILKNDYRFVFKVASSSGIITT